MSMMISDKPSSRDKTIPGNRIAEAKKQAESVGASHDLAAMEAELSTLPFLPGFDIVSELGHGGMGVVYKAWQFSLRRMVALKMIRSGRAASAREIERFRTEAMAVARLHHANLVSIHEIGDHCGLPYFVMEFMDGGTLAQRMDGRPVDPSVAAHVVEKLAKAMYHAHEQKIVHRDLKPDNVLLSGAAGCRLEDCVPKITDFGLVKHLNQDLGQTMPGDVLGTPGYMAPEQAMGQIGRIGPSTDIYSLGAILYELLTGQVPFQGVSHQETLHMIATRDPLPPRRIRRTIPTDLETICMKCLERDPVRRYASAAHLADDLHRWQQGEPIQARPVSMLEKAVKWAKRRPAVAAMGMALLLILVASLFLVTVFWQRAEEEARNQARARLGTEHLLSGSYLERGMHLAEQGSVGRGMLWMVRGLEIAARNADADPRAAEMEAIIRRNLSGWSHHVFRRAIKLQHDEGGWVPAVRFSPDGKHMFTASTDRTVRIWDSFSGEEIDKLQHAFKVWDIDISPDGKYLVAACGQVDKNAVQPSRGGVYLWALEAGAKGRIAARLVLANLSIDEYCRKVKFSPDGKKLAVIGENRIHLAQFDGRNADDSPVTAIGRPLCHPNQENPSEKKENMVDRDVTSIAFSPDNSILVSTSLDHTACCWNAATGEMLGEPLGHDGVVESVLFTPDGRYFLTGAGVMKRGEKSARAGKARLWETKTRQVAAEMDHPGKVRSIAISRDGKLLATSSYVFDLEKKVVKSAEVRFWQGPTRHSTVALGRPLLPPIPQPHNVWAMEFSPDGHYLFSGGEDGHARIWRTATGTRVGPSFFHRGNVMSLAVSPTENRVISGGCGGGHLAMVWDFPTSQVHGVLYHDRWIAHVQWHPDGQSILCRTDDCRGQFWDLKTMLPQGEPIQELGLFNFTGDGKKILAVKPTPGRWPFDELQWIDPGTGKADAHLLTDLRNAYRLSISRDQRRVIALLGNPTLHVKDCQTNEYVFPPMKHEFTLTGASFTSDGQFIASIDSSNDHTRGNIQLCEADTGKVVRRWAVPHHLQEMALCPGDRLLVTSGNDRQITFWDLQTGKSAGAPLLHPHQACSLSFSTDGKLLATGTDQPAGRIWDVASRRLIGPPLTSRNHANRIGFHPSGKLLMVGDDASSAVVIWKVPEPVAGSFEEVKTWVEYLSGMAPNPNETETVLENEELLQRRARLRIRP